MNELDIPYTPMDFYNHLWNTEDYLNKCSPVRVDFTAPVISRCIPSEWVEIFKYRGRYFKLTVLKDYDYNLLEEPKLEEVFEHTALKTIQVELIEYKPYPKKEKCRINI